MKRWHGYDEFILRIPTKELTNMTNNNISIQKERDMRTANVSTARGVGAKATRFAAAAKKVTKKVTKKAPAKKAKAKTVRTSGAKSRAN